MLAHRRPAGEWVLFDLERLDIFKARHEARAIDSSCSTSRTPISAGRPTIQVHTPEPGSCMASMRAQRQMHGCNTYTTCLAGVVRYSIHRPTKAASGPRIADCCGCRFWFWQRNPISIAISSMPSGPVAEQSTPGVLQHRRSVVVCRAAIEQKKITHGQFRAVGMGLWARVHADSRQAIRTLPTPHTSEAVVVNQIDPHLLRASPN